MPTSQKHPFLILTISLVIGIVLYIYTELQISLYVTIIVALILIIIKFSKTLKEALIIIFLVLYGCSMSYYKLKSEEFEKLITIEGICSSYIGGNGYLVLSKLGNIYLSKYNILFYLKKKSNPKTKAKEINKQIPLEGDSIKFQCKLKRTNFSSNQFDKYLKYAGIKYKTKFITSFTILSKNHITISRKIQKYFISKIDSLYKDNTVSAIIKAICIGDRTTISSETKNLFTITGCVHLLAVSGLHVGAIFLLISNLLKLIPIKKKYIELICLPCIWIYTLITGASPSAIRASIIITFIILGKSFNKDDNKLNILFASAFLTLIINPMMLCNISFQLSYSAYAGIILFYKPLSIFLQKELKFHRNITNAISICTSAQILITPLSFYYFKDVNITSIVINTIIMPLTAPLLYTSIVTILLPYKIFFFLAIIPDFISRLLITILNILSHIVYNIHIENISVLHILFTYFTILSLFSLIIKRNKKMLITTYIALITQTFYCCLYNLII